MVEFWRAGGSESTTSIEAAAMIEEEGWDGQMFMDSQSLSADPFVRMGVWAAGTKRLKLSSGVTNPSTRHVAVVAGAAATVQAISGGRAVLGIGRGDSALAYLGHAPTSLASFHQALHDLQILLSGGEVGFASRSSISDARSIDTMTLADRPRATRLQWLPERMPKVPLDVAATGPRVIEMSAPLCERLTFSVGAMPERISWAIDLARAARLRHQKTDEGISYGVQVVVVCHPDVEVVREAATRIVAPLVRFQVIQGRATGPGSGKDAGDFAAVQTGYDMTKHGLALSNKVKGASLSWDFVRRFAIVGSPDHCTQRLLQIAALGIERFVIVGPGYHPEADTHATGLFVREVMPALRAALGPLS